MIERINRLYTLYVYTFLILASSPALPNSKLPTRNPAAADHFAKMLSSIIKINEKRVRSIKTLINLDDLYKASSALRDGVSSINKREPKEKFKVIAVIIGNDKDIKKVVEQLINVNVLKYENNKRSNAPLVNSKDIWRQTRRDFDSDDSSENCDDSEKHSCRVITKKVTNRENNQSCRPTCRRGCRKACLSAFKNFCLTYACDYSMKTKIVKNCKRSCLYKFRDKD